MIWPSKKALENLLDQWLAINFQNIVMGVLLRQVKGIAKKRHTFFGACDKSTTVGGKPRSACSQDFSYRHTSSSTYTILLPNVAPVAPITANIPVAILLLIDLFCLLLSMPFGFLPVHIVQTFGLDQLIHLHIRAVYEQEADNTTS